MSRLLATVALVLGLSVVVPVATVDVANAQPTAAQEQMHKPKPSGFWGAGERGPGAYRWKLLGIGVAIAAVSGLVMWRLVRRASADRSKHPS